jgi:hypothetical protein
MYTKEHPPTYAVLRRELGGRKGIWRVVFFWPEKTGAGFRHGLTEQCAHKHTTYHGAFACAHKRVPQDQVRTSADEYTGAAVV